MLQFLLVVFLDIKNFLLGKTSPRVKQELIVYMEKFLLTLSMSIPHNLHDEVF